MFQNSLCTLHFTLCTQYSASARLAFLLPFPDFKPGEPVDLDILSEFARKSLDLIKDLGPVNLDKFLLLQAYLLVEFFQFPIHDPVHDVFRFPGFKGLGLIYFPLLFHQVGRHLFTPDVQRTGRGDPMSIPSAHASA